MTSGSIASTAGRHRRRAIRNATAGNGLAACATRGRRGLLVADTSSKPDPFARSMFAPGTSDAELAASLKRSLEKAQ